MINEQLKKEFERDIEDYGKNLILVKANPKKGFNFPFYLYIPPVDPGDMKTSIIMDCLNDYEEELPEGMRENSKAIKTVYEMFSNDTVIEASENGANTNDSDAQEEEETKSLERMYYRMALAIGPINRINGSIIRSNQVPKFPIIVPIIPGFKDSKVETVNKVKSQLDEDVIRKLAPQIKAMYEYAREIIKEKTKGKAKKIDGIINFGYSKSSIFASNFMAYYPELCKGGFFGCGSLGTLPLDSIVLKVVEDESKNPNPLFYKGENGEIIKEVKKEEFNRISKEYKDEKREHQKDIVEGEKDGTYSTYIVPLNFPLGIADIEHYRKLSELDEKDEAGNVVKSGKEVYRNLLKNIPIILFVSEQEEKHTGTYAYLDTYGEGGILNTKAGTNMSEELKKKKIDCPDDWILFQKILADNNFGNVELAGMSNRILESVDFVNAVFGRGVNDRFHSYRQLYELIGANVQTRIYKGFSHYNASFYTIGEGEGSTTVFASQSLWNCLPFRKNLSSTFNVFDKGENLQLSDDEGTVEAVAVSPVFQLCRRYLANGGDIQALVGLEEDVLNGMFNALAKDKSIKFDEFTKDDIEGVIKRARVAAAGKDGLEDVWESGARSGEVVGATGVVMSAAQLGDNDKVIPDGSQTIS